MDEMQNTLYRRKDVTAHKVQKKEFSGGGGAGWAE